MMQPQTGIASLPPQMPGQAQGIQQVLPQMKPQVGGAQGATPALVAPLSQQAMPQLLQEFNNPQSKFPKYAVLAAMKEREEKTRMAQAMQGQNAMQQSQQQGTVADEVVSRAQASMPPRMATGGPVAFEGGGDIGGDSLEAFALDELRVREAQIAKKRAEDKAKYEFLKNTAPEVAARMAAENPELVAPVAAPVQAPRPAPIPPKPAPGLSALVPPPQKERVKRVAAAPVVKPAAEDLPEAELAGMLKPFDDRAVALAARKALPADVVKSNEGLARLMQEQLAAQRGEAKTFADASREARDLAMQRASVPIWQDAQGMLGLAAMIDPRKGKTMSSLAAGAEKYLGGQQAAKENAAKEFAAAQREERIMQGNIRQTQMLEAQRQNALARGEMDRVNSIDDQLNALAAQRDQFKLARATEAFNKAMKTREVISGEKKAEADLISAGKPTETLALLNALFPGQAPSVENLAKVVAARSGPAASERQDLAEVKALVASLRDQADPSKNFDKPSRDQAGIMLRQAQAKLAEMSGLGGSAAKLPAAAASQLKEGVVTSFANGQQWTIENGQPKQVK